MAQFNFLKNARTAELLDELKKEINTQISAGVISVSDVIKIIELVKNVNRLRRALKFL